MRADKLAVFEENMYREDKSALTLKQQEILQRLEMAHTYMLDNPIRYKNSLKDKLMSKFGIDRTQAYRDMQLVEQLLGNMSNGAKEWHRYRAIAMSERTYEQAEDAGNFKEMNAANRNYIEATRLKDDDADAQKFDKVAVLPMEPSSDPTLLRGVTPIPHVNKRIDEMLAKYDKDIEIEDAIIIEDLPSNEDE